MAIEDDDRRHSSTPASFLSFSRSSSTLSTITPPCLSGGGTTCQSPVVGRRETREEKVRAGIDNAALAGMGCVFSRPPWATQQGNASDQLLWLQNSTTCTAVPLKAGRARRQRMCTGNQHTNEPGVEATAGINIRLPLGILNLLPVAMVIHNTRRKRKSAAAQQQHGGSGTACPLMEERKKRNESNI